MVDHQIRVPHPASLIVAASLAFAACAGAEERPTSDVTEVTVGPTATARASSEPEPVVTPAAPSQSSQPPATPVSSSIDSATAVASSFPSQPLPGLPPGTGTAVSAAQRAQAEQLFKEGREAIVRGDIALGCSKLAQSLQAEEAGGTLINLGDCSEKLGNTAQACRAYRRAQRLFRAKADDVRFEFSKQRADKLRCPA